MGVIPFRSFDPFCVSPPVCSQKPSAVKQNKGVAERAQRDVQQLAEEVCVCVCGYMQGSGMGNRGLKKYG